MGKEFKQRVSGRGIPEYELQVTNQENGEVVGILGDITMSGAKIYANSEFAPGTILQLGIALPKNVDCLDRLQLEATCRWCKPFSTSDQWEVGFEFTGSHSREESHALGALIHVWSI